MKTSDIVILSIGIGFTLIGFHQVFKGGFVNNYWIFMLSIGTLAIYQLRRMNRAKKEEQSKHENPK